MDRARFWIDEKGLDPDPARGGRATTLLDVSDEELTDLWEHGETFGAGISDQQHLRIAWVLHRPHGATEAREHLLNGTRSACHRYGCHEKFDATMTERWSDDVADAIAADGPGESAAAFLRTHLRLLRGDLFGRPR